MNYDSNRDNVDLFFDEMNRPQETVIIGSFFPGHFPVKSMTRSNEVKKGQLN